MSMRGLVEDPGGDVRSSLPGRVLTGEGSSSPLQVDQPRVADRPGHRGPRLRWA